MEKQTSSGGGEAKRFTRQKIFGTNSLQIGEEDASDLVGCIVEKGISDKPLSNPTPSSLPKPTVLPFPVARHRSHGPHWRPVSSKVGEDENDDSDNNIKDDEEDNDFMEFDPVKALANPVQRRRKKGLDFSRWKEIIQDDNSSLGKKSEEDMLPSRHTRGKTKDEGGIKTADKRTSSSADKGIIASMTLEAKPQLYNSYGGFINTNTAMELDNSNKPDLQEKVRDPRICDDKEELKFEAGCKQVCSDDSFGSPDELRRMEQNNLTSSMASSCSSSIKVINEPESMSLESQIDAENRARIKQMSAEEIAEAQAEILEKMNPALLKLLQKRGEEKVKKKNNSISEVGTGYESVNQHVENTQDGKHFIHMENDIAHTTITPPSEYTENKLNDENNMTKTSTTAGSSSWNDWSTRVEAVRQLRFSLVGDVVENDIALVSVNDNVIERDYLRTEGDPGAAGYTIKEAVALTRSVVPGQRALALHLLSSVLDKALHNICEGKVGHLVRNESKVDKSVDWEAVWAFALGPEPELVLSVR